jgi:hypothetical protein
MISKFGWHPFPSIIGQQITDLLEIYFRKAFNTKVRAKNKAQTCLNTFELAGYY